VIRLISSEWLRVRSRRLVKVLTALAVIGIVVGIGIGAVNSHRPTDDELAQARRRADLAVEDCIAQGGYGEVEPGGDVEGFCREFADPSLFLESSPMRRSDLPELVRGSAFVAILLGLVIGASAVGASWQSGTMTTILSWEPRRVRFALVRAAVVAAACAVLVVALFAVFAAVFWLATGLRGVTDTPPEWGAETIETIARVAALAACASVIGGAIAMIGRNTAAALGAVFVYLAVLEGIVRGLRPAIGRFLLSDSIAAVVIGSEMRLGDGSVVTLARAAVVVAAYTLGLWAIATVAFRARDVQ
jgi:hypothetical protein